MQIVSAQEYYIPKNIKNAYEKNTRDFSGKPGKNYFQNKSDYTIKADFNPGKGILKGKEWIEYFNNSPDSLGYIVIRLYHDIFKPGNLRDEDLSEEYLTKGVELHSLVINNIEYIGNDQIFSRRNGTNLFVALPAYILPGKSISVYASWETIIPEGHVHRFGNYGPSDWFIAYWYPQIAVYDDIEGWDELDYTGAYEFYNDFNNYEVEISVPKNHMVWATGTWENPHRILAKKVLERYQQALTADEKILIITDADWAAQSVFTKNSSQTFKYSVTEITDFAFAVSDNYEWNATSVIPNSDDSSRTVVHAVFPSTSSHFKDLSMVGAKALKHFADETFGITYPFPKVVVFNGDGGMEFPMMVNMRNDNIRENYFVLMHEIFHGYFPFATGCNERKYAWMDEGLTSYLPIATETYLGGGDYFQLPGIIRRYAMFAGAEKEVPLMIPTVQTRNYSYYHNAYYHSSVAYSVLENYLGQEKFREIIRQFYIRWKGKHPTGYDFIFTLNDLSGEDLYWLINPWFFGQGWADIAIAGVEQDVNDAIITLNNVGGLPVPVDIRLINEEGKLFSKSINPDAWKEAAKTLDVKIENTGSIKKVEIGNPNFPDTDYNNNYYTIK